MKEPLLRLNSLSKEARVTGRYIMKKIDQVGRIIEETDDFQVLVEKLLMCFDGINEDQRREFMSQISSKIDDFKVYNDLILLHAKFGIMPKLGFFDSLAI